MSTPYDEIGSQFIDTEPNQFTNKVGASSDDTLHLIVSRPAKLSELEECPALPDLDAGWTIIPKSQPSPSAPPSDAVPELTRSDETVSIDGTRSLHSQSIRQGVSARITFSPDHNDIDDVEDPSDTASPIPPLTRSPLSPCSLTPSSDDESMLEANELLNSSDARSFSHNLNNMELRHDIGLNLTLQVESQHSWYQTNDINRDVPTDSPSGNEEGKSSSNEPRTENSSNDVSKKRNCEEATKLNKRQRRDKDELEADSSHSNAPNLEQSKTEKHLACPFYKLDPNRHRRCYSHILTTPSRVKQHLVRAHRAPLYCRRCLDTFKDVNSLNRHSRNSTPCHLNLGDPPSGLTEMEVNQLRSRVGKNYKSDEEHWYWIFGLLFPDAPKPDSPYIDRDVGEDVTSFVEFGRTIGSKVSRRSFEKLLASRQLLSPDLVQTLVVCFDDVFKELFEKWKMDRTDNVKENSPASVITLCAVDMAAGDPPRRTDTSSTAFTDMSAETGDWQLDDFHVVKENSPDAHVTGKVNRRPLPNSSSRRPQSPDVVIAGDEDAAGEDFATAL